MDIHSSVKFSLSARFDLTYPKGVHIGAYSYIAFDAAILAHDMTRGLYLHTYIGECCFIGSRSIILPGVKIGNSCIVGSGSVVTKDIPAGSVVAGNPARIYQQGLELTRYGRFKDAEQTKERLIADGAFD
nr:acyltransferase [Methylobacterium sp. Leaf111]